MKALCIRKIRGKRFLRLALPFLGILFYYMGVYHYCLLCQWEDICQITCGTESSFLTREDYENIQRIQQEEELEEKPLRFAFWGKIEDADVENPQFHRHCSVDVWKIRGSLELLFGEFARLSEQDLQGCLLDAGTAQELFGSVEVIGSEIFCEGRRLTVRGVLKEESAVLVIRPEEREATDHITLENATPSEVQNFQMRYGISGTVANSSFLGEILQMLLLFFPVCLALCLFGELKGSEMEVLRWGLLLFMLWHLLRRLEIPDAMIPDRWSNFQFWRDWQEVFKKNIMAYLRQEKTGRELARMICFLKGAACAALAVVFVCISRLFLCVCDTPE